MTVGGGVTTAPGKRSSVGSEIVETGMRTASILTAVAALLLTWTAASAQGRDYPFCAYGSKTSEAMMCDYATLAQCQAATSAAGGSCLTNPRIGQTPAQKSTQPGKR
jgi:hypothetical protein